MKDEISQYISHEQKDGLLPELIGRRKGFSNPKYPCFFHTHRMDTLGIHYMDPESCKEFNTTLEEIKGLGAGFIHYVVHPHDTERVMSTLQSLVKSQDDQKIISYFQRIKLRPEGTEGYTLVLTTAKLDLKKRAIICISNTTDQLPSFTKKISNALNERHDLQTTINQYFSLTKREKEVMKLVAAGHQVKAMAESLNISTRTIEQHKKNLYKKINAKSAADVIAFAYTLT